MRALILGATGLIGSHALRALRAGGHTVIGASRHRPAEVYRYLILPGPENCPP